MTCVDNFIHTLRELADGDHFKNLSIKNSIRVYKYEQEHPELIPPVIDDKVKKVIRRCEITFDRRVRLLAGHVIRNDDGSYNMTLSTGITIHIRQKNKSYNAVTCHYLKSHFPELTRHEIMEQIGYSEISSVNKAIAAVDTWYTSGIFPHYLDVIK